MRFFGFSKLWLYGFAFQDFNTAQGHKYVEIIRRLILNLVELGFHFGT